MNTGNQGTTYHMDMTAYPKTRKTVEFLAKRKSAANPSTGASRTTTQGCPVITIKLPTNSPISARAPIFGTRDLNSMTTAPLAISPKA